MSIRDKSAQRHKSDNSLIPLVKVLSYPLISNQINSKKSNSREPSNKPHHKLSMTPAPLVPLKQNKENMENDYQRLKKIIVSLDLQLSNCRNETQMKLKDQQLLEKRQEHKDLEQELILTKIDLAQVKSELDEYHYQIIEYKKQIAVESKESLSSSETIANELTINETNRKFSSFKMPLSLVTKTQLIGNMNFSTMIKKWNPFSKGDKNGIKELKLQEFQMQDAYFNSQLKGDQSNKEEENAEVSDISEELKAAFPEPSIRDAQQESVAASVYLRYFLVAPDEKILDQWFKYFLPLIKENNTNLTQNKRLKREIKKGIPIPLRRQVWQLLIENKLRITSHMFQFFRDFPTQTLSKETTHLLEEDIPRTFPHLNDLFEEIRSLATSLREVLLAYLNFRPDLGYIQGMSYVAGMLLLHSGPPEECFKVLCNILNQDIVFDFYNFNLKQIRKTYKVFWRLLRDYAHPMYKNLRDEKVSCSAFLFEWVLTLFSSQFEIELVAYLWDQIFFFGEKYILKVAVAICLVIQRKFYDKIEKIDGLALIKKARIQVGKQELIITLQKMKLKTQQIASLYEMLDYQN